MTKFPKRRARRDLNQISKRIVDSATVSSNDDEPSPTGSVEATDTQADTPKRHRGAKKPAQKKSRK